MKRILPMCVVSILLGFSFLAGCNGKPFTQKPLGFIPALSAAIASSKSHAVQLSESQKSEFLSSLTSTAKDWFVQSDMEDAIWATTADYPPGAVKIIRFKKGSNENAKASFTSDGKMLSFGGSVYEPRPDLPHWESFNNANELQIPPFEYRNVSDEDLPPHRMPAAAGPVELEKPIAEQDGKAD